MLRVKEDTRSVKHHPSSSSPRSTDSHFASHVEVVNDDYPSKTHISDAERAQIWAALSRLDDQTHGKYPLPSSTKNESSIAADLGRTTTTTNARPSKVKQFGRAVRKVFMNDQTVPQRHSRKRDSWDDIYRSKDNAKIRPIHEEYGIL